MHAAVRNFQSMSSDESVKLVSEKLQGKVARIDRNIFVYEHRSESKTQ